MEVSHKIKMGQREVIEFLKKQKEPLSRGQIAEGMNECATKISAILRKLCEYDEVQYIEVDRTIGMQKYRTQRRLRVFYVSVN